jgi:PPK2 family polyphosphate:nucleotide phosphotransferase
MPNEAIPRPRTKRVDAVGRCRAGSRVDLQRFDPGETFGWDKDAAQADLAAELAVVADLHLKLYAEGTRGMLVVLQATDAGGKGGTIRSVFAGLNPLGVTVEGFGVPTEEERAHDYLWRIHAHAPRRGTIAVFDRSHYEDVLVVRVKELAPEAVWRRRYGHIRDWERMLGDEGFAVVKLFLNVSSDEQRARFQDRIDDPSERWKFRLGDLDDRGLWDAYRKAYQVAIRETTTPAAPWYVVPGDRKWVRNLTVAKILRHHLEQLDPAWPAPEEGIAGLVVD